MIVREAFPSPRMAAPWPYHVQLRKRRPVKAGKSAKSFEFARRAPRHAIPPAREFGGRSSRSGHRKKLRCVLLPDKSHNRTRFTKFRLSTVLIRPRKSVTSPGGRLGHHALSSAATVFLSSSCIGLSLLVLTPASRRGMQWHDHIQYGSDFP